LSGGYSTIPWWILHIDFGGLGWITQESSLIVFLRETPAGEGCYKGILRRFAP